MSVRVRIAPSPTGKLHIGTARTAVFNWLFARHHGGTFILRVEDTDTARSRPEFTENIKAGLTWLGMTWDEGPYFQSERLHLYREAVQTLLDKGLAYRCFTSEEELKALRDRQRAVNQAPRYDNRHRDLTPEQCAAFEAEGRRPVIRFRIDDDREVVWDDCVRGRVAWQAGDLGGDMVIARRSETEDFGQPLYNLAVVVDDLEMQISHVIRGEDHIANTAKQILLYEAFGAKEPAFAHTPLILNEQGQKLSKRDNVTSIFDFRDLGLLPKAMANYMALLGWTPPDSTQELFTLSEAAKLFSLDRVSKAGAKFDWAKLDWINSQYLHHLPPTDLVELLVPRWQAAGFAFDLERDRPWLEDMAALIATSLTRLSDATEQSQVFFAKTLSFSDAATTQLQQDGVGAILQATADRLADRSPFDLESAQDLVKHVTKACGVKKGVVMKSLRAALTGDLRGHDLMQSWLLFNRRGLDASRLQDALAIAKK
ncbi:glutamyl-tRNA synthetase, bacterial family [Rubidibacter lacunae KORDI 51-2]|uniref:Glutamate--tRNA ligase n=1 Tax=Rubidibacter lacunae KORDI 51-2 TaxID=582515 RepID=U5DMP9_9CHRO|nr:glutamate--tRNA ligase [Rubidibacter lacunae]ERN42107.1 glutamyl-tRNA synthetase, bacterial family [Rubidibacter lacunae KORDI 51-2]